ncbi:2,3-diaminopropionate biosynthesis protein SbnA [Micromonospora sp. CB01531]|uniref:2,3-diaminopropionate biosynthesis protein SbnA n=1 Tax=Micromonospora sp. CB01531 TaxID=1718947 RepID=UPI00093E6F4E|nr:2,3-diaminopropionate biosynthesis protein SbnA [Micromonospora sp. CB01531]OKI50898.1 2,3-diaminopropionate biosynthesis protein SbnA [Micromonospora sp. CB01531]
MTSGNRDRNGLMRHVESLAAAMMPTPLVPLADERLDLYAKLEFSNFSGSAKDRSALWILRQAILREQVTRKSVLVESSSGNFAIALASLCASLGLEFVPVIDSNVNRSTENFLRALSSRVERVHDIDDTGGFLKSRLRRVQDLRAELPDSYWPNQYANTDGADAHYRFTASELCDALDRITHVFVGVGTAGTIAGLSRRLKKTDPRVRVIAVDVEGSVIFGGTPGRRRIPGIGSSIIPPLLQHALIDETLLVSEYASIVGCIQLWQRHGIFAGGSSGSVYAAVQRYFAGYRGPRPRVVFLCADRGNAYADTVFNPQWVAETYPERIDDVLISSTASV